MPSMYAANAGPSLQRAHSGSRNAASSMMCRYAVSATRIAARLSSLALAGTKPWISRPSRTGRTQKPIPSGAASVASFTTVPPIA